MTIDSDSHLHRCPEVMIVRPVLLVSVPLRKCPLPQEGVIKAPVPGEGEGRGEGIQRQIFDFNEPKAYMH